MPTARRGLIAERFGPSVRYSGAGLGYQLAPVIASGPAPLIAAAILTATRSATYISVYLIGCAVISMAALLLMPRRAVRRWGPSGYPTVTPPASPVSPAPVPGPAGAHCAPVCSR
jgi:hypothetical protein